MMGDTYLALYLIYHLKGHDCLRHVRFLGVSGLYSLPMR